LFGRKGLTPEEAKEVRIGTLLANRAAAIVRMFHDAGRPWFLETPAPSQRYPSVFRLPELVKLSELPNVHSLNIMQCEFGAPTQKPTALLYGNVELRSFPTECSHVLRRWVVPWSGQVYTAPHPRLAGRQWAVLAEDWHKEMLEDAEPAG